MMSSTSCSAAINPAGWSTLTASRLQTVAIERVDARVGVVPPGVMADLDEALRLHLAL